ncbi:MAG: toll/interleukin-1 receptor domain-containing protein [bacterium]|nr:toll/interleukin-1 receptor domain-containing protein [bacterium]
MSKVFIAHSSENKDVAQDIFYALTKKGLEVYLDEKSLEAGEQFHSKLRELILEPALSRCGTRKNNIPSIDCFIESICRSQEGLGWNRSSSSAWTIWG